MRGLTLYQPWATLVATGAKKIETRSWPTSYRGPLAIHAGKGKDDLLLVAHYNGLAFPEHRAILTALAQAGYESPTTSLPLGAIVAVADLVDCREITVENAPPAPERFFGDYTPGRYAWILENVRRLDEPVPCRGALGVWEVPVEVARRVEEVANGA